MSYNVIYHPSFTDNFIVIGEPAEDLSKALLTVVAYANERDAGLNPAHIQQITSVSRFDPRQGWFLDGVGVQGVLFITEAPECAPLPTIPEVEDEEAGVPLAAALPDDDPWEGFTPEQIELFKSLKGIK